MNKQDAEVLIRQVCASYNGTLKDHQCIQEALNSIFGVKSEHKIESKVEEKD